MVAPCWLFLYDMTQLLHIVNWDVAKPADNCTETGYDSVTFCMWVPKTVVIYFVSDSVKFSIKSILIK
jgi:hypothetical protein